MKARVILLFLVCFSCVAFAQSNKTVITSWGQISLVGNWRGGDFGDGDDHRSIPCLSVDAFLENSTITLNFQEIVDDVTIVISSESKTVLTYTFLVDFPKTYNLPIGIYTPGVYLLELSNSYGGYVCGWFELK